MTRRYLKVTTEVVEELAAESGIRLYPDHEPEWADILNCLDESAKAILEMDDYLPEVDFTRYPRIDVHVPQDTVRGGWALKVVLPYLLEKIRN